MDTGGKLLGQNFIGQNLASDGIQFDPANNTNLPASGRGENKVNAPDQLFAQNQF